MANYGFDTNFISEKLTPGKLRRPRRLAWLRTLLYPLQVKFIDIFTYYRLGASYGNWSKIPTYAAGTRKRYGMSIYEALRSTVAEAPPYSPTAWLLIQKNWIGAEERLKYNGQKIVFEFLLNKIFPNTFNTNQIYILTVATDSNAFWVGDDASGKLNGTAGVDGSQQYFVGTSYTVGYYNFTINVPLALFNDLGATNIERENTIRAVADKYRIAGMLYNVVSYVPNA